jgi:phenylacetate-CoA ligase
MRVTGRNDDMLIIRGVNVFPSQVEAALIGLPGLAPYYQIVLSCEGALDAMTVEVERALETPGDADFAAAKSREVQHRLKSLLGVTCKVVVKPPGQVPRSQGKAVRVRDERSKA